MEEAFAATLGPLDTSVVGRKVRYYASLTSTMDVAREEARQGAPEGTIVVAGEQTAGRGRLKRTWLTPPGSLAVSVILRPSLSQLPSLIMIASLAVSRSVATVTGLHAPIKWPNDVLLGGHKVCGILIENGLHGRQVDYSIIGMGLNVNVRVADYPDLVPVATSLSDQAGHEVSLVATLRQLLIELDALYTSLGDGQAVFAAWRRELVTLGKPVRVKAAASFEEGVAEDVDSDGSLRLRQQDGSLINIAAGDVTLRE